ncbi:MAG: transposase [Pseudomonadota bacterium]
MGLAGTELERAQATTIRLRLLKIGAQVRVTARRVWVQMAGSFPLQSLFWQVADQLRC